MLWAIIHTNYELYCNFLCNSRDVSVGVQPEHFRCICGSQLVNVFVVFGDFIAFWNDVSFEKVEFLREHCVAEPDFAECVEKALVVVIRHATPVLYLPEHVPYCAPVDAL